VAGAPQVVIIAGPNGAGKTTSSRGLLPVYGISTFVNADQIAQGLSGLSPDDSAIEAGILMLEKIRKLVGVKASFAFETTLASRTYGPWMRERLSEGFEVHLHYVWLASADMAVERVAQRVRAGGHSIPENTIRRRYEGSLRNFFEQYRAVATSWSMWNNSVGKIPKLIAARRHREEYVHDRDIWKTLTETYSGGAQPARK
jgi:predicted ABC-type ATPase